MRNSGPTVPALRIRLGRALGSPEVPASPVTLNPMPGWPIELRKSGEFRDRITKRPRFAVLDMPDTRDFQTKPTQVELFVRTLGPRAHPGLESVIDQLETLAHQDFIGGYSIHIWGKRILRSEQATRTTQGEHILERITQFEDWATRNGLSIDSFFEECVIRNQFTAAEYSTYLLPTLAAAEVSQETLIRMAPCKDDEEVYTVTEMLQQIGKADETAREPRPEILHGIPERSRHVH